MSRLARSSRRPPRRGVMVSCSFALRRCGKLELAGRQGFEPRFCGSEPHVLPLNDLPVEDGRVGYKIGHRRSTQEGGRVRKPEPSRRPPPPHPSPARATAPHPERERAPPPETTDPSACSGWAVEAAPEGQGHLAQGFNPGWPGRKAMSARAAERFGYLLRLLRPPTGRGQAPPLLWVNACTQVNAYGA